MFYSLAFQGQMSKSNVVIWWTNQASYLDVLQSIVLSWYQLIDCTIIIIIIIISAFIGHVLQFIDPFIGPLFAFIGHLLAIYKPRFVNK